MPDTDAGAMEIPRKPPYQKKRFRTTGTAGGRAMKPVAKGCSKRASQTVETSRAVIGFVSVAETDDLTTAGTVR
jgi:hypothetical protein